MFLGVLTTCLVKKPASGRPQRVPGGGGLGKRENVCVCVCLGGGAGFLLLQHLSQVVNLPTRLLFK